MIQLSLKRLIKDRVLSYWTLDEGDYLAEEKNNMIMRKVTRNLENMLKVHLKKIE